MQAAKPIYWLPIAIIATFFAVTGFATVTYINTNRLHEAELVVAESFEVREAASQLVSAMRDAQLAQRGYVIAGTEEFLEPFPASMQAAEMQLKRLKDLAKGDNELLHHVDLLSDTFDQHRLHLQRTIEMRRTEEGVRISDELILLVKSGVGKAAMDKASRVTDDILELERQRLRSSESRTQSLTSLTQSTITLGNLLSTGMIVVVGIAAWSDRKKRDLAEAAYVQQRDELSAVIDSAFEGIVTFGKELTVRFMNPAAAKCFGVDRNVVVGRKLSEFFPDERTPGNNSSFTGFLNASVTSDEFEDRQSLRSDGRTFPISGSMVRSSSKGDDFVTIKFRDMTDAKTSEAKQREYSAILEQINDAVLVCEMDGTIRNCNASAAKLLELNREQLIDGNIVKALNADAELWDIDRAVLLPEGVEIAQRTWISPLGNERVLEQRRSLIRDHAGEASGQLVFLIDITDRVRQELKTRRNQRLESIGTLAGGIAHDLNNVLTPIMVSVELLQRGSKSPERLLKNIATSADRGSKMIKKLLAFAGGDRPERKPIDLNLVITEIQELLAHTLPQSIDMEIALEDNLWSIVGDLTELSQVVMNLALNARDAMPEGGKLSIGVSNFMVDSSKATQSDTLKPGPHLLLTVADNGQGIPRELMDRIFDPFFTTKPQGKGTGLGLATTLGIVRSYGGDMTVYSELGIGTKISVYFPCAAQTAVAIAKSDQRSAAPVGNGELILLVDDEELILDSARETLESKSYTVITARSGAEAISMVERQPGEIKLIVLDMMMPGMDGPKTVAAIRQIIPNTLVLASSGLRRPNQSPDSFHDFCGFLPKPYSSEQLLRAVRDALDKQ